MKKIKIAAAVLAGCILLMSLAACAQSDHPIVESAEAAHPPESIASNLEEELFEVHTFATFRYYSQEDLMEESALVVRGTVINVSHPFFIENIYSGGQDIFTDYLIEVHEVLRGETDQTEIIVRTMGGVTNEIVSTTNFHPNFRIGTQYLLFLGMLGGGDFDVPGEYYAILGGLQGIFSTTADPSETRGLTVFDQAVGGEFFGLGELRDEIEAVNAEVPIPDEDYYREMGRRNMQQSIDNGVFTMTDEEFYESVNRPWYPGRVVEPGVLWRY